MKDRKLYCLHVFDVKNYFTVDMYPVEVVIEKYNFDKNYINDILKNHNMVGFNIEDGDLKENFIFSYDINCLKNKAYKEKELKIDKLKLAIETIENVDIETLISEKSAQ